jgi:hypothetical protein
MAPTKIQAAEQTIGEVFSDTYDFTIPHYQRPYAWTTEQAGELLDDLLAAAAGDASVKESDPYFLGSVVLIKEEKEPHSDVVDGQQRLTTLTILLSVLRAHVSSKFVGALEKRLFREGDPIDGTVDLPRLRLRAKDQPFFEKYLQQPDHIEQLGALQTDILSDSQRNAVRNGAMFHERLAALERSTCERLVQFINANTYLVVVSTQDFDSAYRIFAVLNERGLDLTLTDILKSDIIGQIPEHEKDSYTAVWEGEEEDLGREDFVDLFSHIRMVFAKTKARGAILKEFRSQVLNRVPDPRRFVDDVLVPMSNAYETVTRADYPEGPGSDEVRDLLRWLNRLDNRDWVAPAIRYLSRPSVTTPELLRFLTDLERLAASQHVRRVDITRRIERYGRLLTAIESGEDLYTTSSPLQLDGAEREATRRALDGEIYTVTRIRLYVLMRLDSVLSTGGATYNYPLITVEHVLPQTPPADSEWRTVFTDRDRAFWVHRLANLVLLTRRKNSGAGTYAFERKKTRYFTGSDGVSPFALTSQVLAAPEWTPASLTKRQEHLLTTLSKTWRL